VEETRIPDQNHESETLVIIGSEFIYRCKYNYIMITAMMICLVFIF